MQYTVLYCKNVLLYRFHTHKISFGKRQLTYSMNNFIKQNKFQYFHVAYIQGCHKVGKSGKGREFREKKIKIRKRSGIWQKIAKSLEKVGIMVWAGSDRGTVEYRQ